MEQQMTWREAAEKVLQVAPGPIHYVTLAHKILEEGLRTDDGQETPWTTLYCELRSAIKQEADSCPVQYVGNGFFVSWEKAKEILEPPSVAPVTEQLNNTESETISLQAVADVTIKSAKMSDSVVEENIFERNADSNTTGLQRDDSASLESENTFVEDTKQIINKKQSGITNRVIKALNEVLSEIDFVANQIEARGGSAFREKAFDEARKLSEWGEKVQEFRARIESLIGNWPTLMHGIADRGMPILKDPGSRVMSSKTRLRVHFTDGTVVEESVASVTFSKALAKLGLDKVASLNRRLGGISLLCKERIPGFQQQEVNGWYISTHSATRDKKECLEYVSKQLGVDLTVEIV